MLHFEALSTEELDKALARVSQKDKNTGRLAALDIYGPNILVSQFSLPRLSRRELKNSLNLEAVGLLSLSPDEIELDYQIFNSPADKLNGVFIAMPKAVIQEYLSRFEQANVACARLSANILSRINAFLYRNQIREGTFCLIDFYNATLANLVIFTNGTCEFLRQISYENLDDAEREIIRSFKYACGKSESKELAGVYSFGDVGGKDTLIAHLQKDLGITITHCDYQAADANGTPAKDFFRLDLIKRYRVALPVRKRITAWANLVIALGLAICAGLGIRVAQQQAQIKKISATFTMADYQHALDLQKQIRGLQHAK
ncbi:MAG TPA: hypothetical protein VMD52_01345 [Patescibacteria group bacterium]|nr:hypothetical protein [Patescibacteria group bacterium]